MRNERKAMYSKMVYISRYKCKDTATSDSIMKYMIVPTYNKLSLYL